MLRMLVLLFGFLLAFGQTTYPTTTPTVDCGSNQVCVIERDRAIQAEQQRLKEKQEQEDYKQSILEMEQARLEEMQRQSALMEEQLDETTYKDEKIEAQEEEIESQQDEINNLRTIIDKYENEAALKRSTPRGKPSQSAE